MHRTVGFITGAIALAVAVNYATSDNYWWEGEIKVDTLSRAVFSGPSAIYLDELETETGKETEKGTGVKLSCENSNGAFGVFSDAMCPDKTAATMVTIIPFLFAAATMVPLFTKHNAAPLAAAGCAVATAVVTTILLIELSDGYSNLDGQKLGAIELKSDTPSLTMAGVIDAIVALTVLPLFYTGVVIWDMMHGGEGWDFF